VYTSSIRRYEFTLWAYPVNGQDPLGIPYMVDVTPCLTTANFYTRTHAGQLVLDRNPTSSSTTVISLYPTYFNNWYNDQASHCPIIRYFIKTASSGTWTDARIAINNHESRTQASLTVRNDLPFTLPFRIFAHTMSKNSY
jgi:hypothetical protein